MIALKDVFIKLTSSIESNGDVETFELTTDGRLSVRGGKTMLMYEESDTIGASGVKSIISADDDHVVIQRSGGMTGRLTIMKNKRQSCIYDTAEGAVSLGIFGEELVNSLSDEGGQLEMAYTLDVNNEFLSHNRIKITVDPRS